MSIFRYLLISSSFLKSRCYSEIRHSKLLKIPLKDKERESQNRKGKPSDYRSDTSEGERKEHGWGRESFRLQCIPGMFLPSHEQVMDPKPAV